MRRLAVTTVMLALVGCGARCGGDATRGDTATAAASVAARPASSPDSGGLPWYLDPDEGCGFDTTVAHPDGERLIAEFLERDAAGEFIQSSGWFTGATECPGHEPGPDAFTVIADYRVTPLGGAADTVRVAVTSTGLGTLVNGSRFEPDSRTIVDTVQAIRTRYGWRIVSPALRQFVRRTVADSVRKANAASAAVDSGTGG